jgi:hypothetical protein
VQLYGPFQSRQGCQARGRATGLSNDGLGYNVIRSKGVRSSWLALCALRRRATENRPNQQLQLLPGRAGSNTVSGAYYGVGG